MPEIEASDLFEIEAALDALETVHDFGADEIGSEHVRECLCGEAAAWRRARKLVIVWRKSLGLKPRLLDSV